MDWRQKCDDSGGFSGGRERERGGERERERENESPRPESKDILYKEELLAPQFLRRRQM